MSRRRSGRDIHGIVLLDKPVGLSSNQALQKARRLLQARKAGHTGTLDPFATGMLPVCFGEASKTAFFMGDASKCYRATAMLGRSTDSGDTEGVVLRELPVPELDGAQIEAVLSRFRGTISQTPPMYSAIKHQGQPLYKLARQGIEIERPSRPVTVFRLELLAWQSPLMSFEVECSKGTYIRTLAEDVCRALGTCGHLNTLRRLSVEPFTEQQMITLDQLEQAVAQDRGEALLLPVDAGLRGWPCCQLDEVAAEAFSHGNPVTHSADRGMIRVYDQCNRILGLGELSIDRLLHPRRVFVAALPGSG